MLHKNYGNITYINNLWILTEIKYYLSFLIKHRAMKTNRIMEV